MSKSLRRHMMMQQNADDGYIQDGLVFHLDGIDKGATDGTWVDLVHGHVFTPQGDPITSMPNGFKWTSFFSYMSGDFGFPTSNNDPVFTIEFCGTGLVTGGSGCVYFCANYDNGAQLVYRTGRLYSYHSGRRYDTAQSRINITNRSFKTISFSKTVCVCDLQNISGNYDTQTHDINQSKNKRISVSTNQSAFGFKGTVHSIRIYNRNLTLDEMLHNQQIDNERFELGL